MFIVEMLDALIKYLLASVRNVVLQDAMFKIQEAFFNQKVAIP